MESPQEGEGTRHRFHIGPLLGAGTFGEVYLARMKSVHGIEQEVAVKLLNPGLHPKSQPVSRMRDEGRMLAALNHPAILGVLDFCYLDGRIGLVTEFVSGADLHDCVHGHDPITTRGTLQVIGLVAEALHAAFETRGADGTPMGLVHRDIKPANIRLTPHATVKLLDFGIAKSDDAQRETATTERMAIGTPSYMAPEVQTYEVLDALPSRDIFALGATMFESLTRELYFEGLDPKGIVRLCNRKERFDEWRSTRMPKLARYGAPIASLTSRMLHWDHEERPTAQEVADLCHAMAPHREDEDLRSWCHRRVWPEPTSKDGPWSGRHMMDSGVATSHVAAGTPGRAIDASAAGMTLAPLLDDHTTLAEPGMGGMHPTAVGPDPGGHTMAATGMVSGGHPAVTTDEHGAIQVGGATIVAADSTMVGGHTTQVVVVAPTRRAQRTKRRRKGIDVGNVAAFMVSLIVVAGAVLMWRSPDAFRHMINGEWGAILGTGGLTSFDVGGGWTDALIGSVEVEKATPGAHVFAWGADVAPEHELAMIALDGSHDVYVQRPGHSGVSVPPGGDVMVTPGGVQVFALWPGLRDYTKQFDADVTPGQTLRILCDVEARSCFRR